MHIPSKRFINLTLAKNLSYRKLSNVSLSIELLSFMKIKKGHSTIFVEILVTTPNSIKRRMPNIMVTFYSHIVNFIFALQLQVSKPQMNHILTFMHGIILTDGRINVSQIRRSTNENRDLSCMTRFLNGSP